MKLSAFMAIVKGAVRVGDLTGAHVSEEYGILDIFYNDIGLSVVYAPDPEDWQVNVRCYPADWSPATVDAFARTARIAADICSALKAAIKD